MRFSENWKRTEIERIQAKTRYENGHWLFTGATDYKGYGIARFNKKKMRVARISCHLYHGADLDDQNWVACHKDECKHYNCWNPEHLYVGTRFDNIRDQIRLGNFIKRRKNK